jgi:transcriptional regulator with XRE-family HTH domain
MIGSRLKTLREARNYSQDDFGGLLGVSGQQVYRWENGRNDPPGDTIAKIAKILDVSADYLLGVSDEPKARLTENDLSITERKLVAAARNGKIAEATQAFAELFQSRQ